MAMYWRQWWTLIGVVVGLIIPGHIFLSDKNPRGNVTKTHERVLLPRVFWSHLHEGFRQTVIYDRE